MSPQPGPGGMSLERAEHGSSSCMLPLACHCFSQQGKLLLPPSCPRHDILLGKLRKCGLDEWSQNHRITE